MELTADSYSVKRSGAKAPISTHPAFPAIVALWFAALLGLGSLVLPVALLERLLTVTHIADLIPSAAPPLGFTARACVALAGAIGGALIGLMLARKVAIAHAPEPQAREFDLEEERPCRPISAHDELGAEGLGSTPDGPALAHKRRSLALAEDNRRSTYLEAVPLPGMPHEPQAALAPEDSPIPLEQPDAEGIAPLELGDFADLAGSGETHAPESDSNAALDALRSRVHTPVDIHFVQDQPMTDRPGFDEPFADDEDHGGLDEFGSLEAAETATQGRAIPRAFEPAPDAVDPLPFAPPSLRRAEADEEREDIEPNAFAAVFADEPAAHLAVIESFAEPGAGADDRPLQELGLVQLAARLGASLEKRRARLAQQAPGVAPVPAHSLAGTEDFEAAEAADAARAMADFFGPAPSGESARSEPADGEATAFADASAPVMPEALQPCSLHGDEEVDEDTLAASFSLPLMKIAQSSSLDEAEDDEEAEGDYSSLLGMKNPFAREQEFVRIDEPEEDVGAIEPAVAFPSPAPLQPVGATPDQFAASSPRPFDPPGNPAKSANPDASRDPGDAERNLRAALATLQRMSGAA